MGKKSIKVVVADDHCVVRQGLCSLLGACPEFTVIGEAQDGPRALEFVAQLRPDVLLLDYGMPGMDGPEVTRHIIFRRPSVKVVMISCHADVLHIQESLEAGALGYVTKFASVAELCAALRAAARGKTFLGSCARIMNSRQLSQVGSNGLTTRQCQILKMIADGLANKQIASELSISMKTVEKHRQEMMDKLGVHNTAGLTRYAVEAGIVGTPVSPDARQSGVDALAAATKRGQR
jgi:DNA-binding NarL/FixJ family response regulator